MARVVGSGAGGVYRRLWDYAQLRPNLGRMPITISRSKAQPLRLPQAYRFAHLQDTYVRPYDYAAHLAARRRMPITITPGGESLKGTLPWVHAVHFAYLKETYVRPWDYAVQRTVRRRKPITISRPTTYAINLPHAYRYSNLRELFIRKTDYARYYVRRAAPTLIRPKAPTLTLPYARRFAYLKKDYERPFDYATHHVNRRRMPITITVAAVGKNLPLQLPHALRFTHLQETYLKRWDYFTRRHIWLDRPTVEVTAVCDDLIERNDIFANTELVRSAADTTKGGHGAGSYITDPDCYVRKY